MSGIKIVQFTLMLIMLPIGFYLQYKVFTIIGATELMWFLFWANMPIIIIIQIISKSLEK